MRPRKYDTAVANMHVSNTDMYLIGHASSTETLAIRACCAIRTETNTLIFLKLRSEAECRFYHRGTSEYEYGKQFMVNDSVLVKYGAATRIRSAEIFNVPQVVSNKNSPSGARADGETQQAAPGYLDALQAASALGLREKVGSSWLCATILCVLLVLALAPILRADGVSAFAVVLTYFVCNSLVKMFVKQTINYGLDCPDFITTLHMISSAMAACSLERPHRKEALAVFPISVFQGGSLLLSNVALLHGGVAFNSMISCCTPIVTVLLETLRGTRTLSVIRAASALLSVAGAVLCVKGETSASMFAFLCSGGSTFLRGAKQVSQGDLLVVSITPLRLVFWASAWSTLLMVPIFLISEGVRPILLLQQIPNAGIVSLLLSMICACVLNICQAFAIKQLGAVMQSVVGNLNLLLVILLSQAWLGEDISAMQFVGVSFLVGGVISSRLAVQGRETPKADMGKPQEQTGEDVAEAR